jgi:hypothetical protein
MLPIFSDFTLQLKQGWFDFIENNFYCKKSLAVVKKKSSFLARIFIFPLFYADLLRVTITGDSQGTGLLLDWSRR